MTQDQLRKLRSYYHSLRHVQDVFAHSPGDLIDHAVVRLFEGELQRIETDFPGLLPPMDTRPHALPRHPDSYHRAGMQTMLGMALGRLEIEVEQLSASPVTEAKDFPFVNGGDLRTIVERDYQELQQCYVAKCWKSVIILAGGMVEAILTDLLLQHKSRALSSLKAQNDKQGKPIDICNWGLVYLILVAVDLKLINPGVDKLSHSIREYRDLVHPIVEIKTGLRVDMEEARIAVEIVNMIHRDLSK